MANPAFISWCMFATYVCKLLIASAFALISLVNELNVVSFELSLSFKRAYLSISDLISSSLLSRLLPSTSPSSTPGSVAPLVLTSSLAAYFVLLLDLPVLAVDASSELPELPELLSALESLELSLAVELSSPGSPRNN